jgi:hypothetical protein
MLLSACPLEQSTCGSTGNQVANANGSARTSQSLQRGRIHAVSVASRLQVIYQLTHEESVLKKGKEDSMIRRYGRRRLLLIALLSVLSAVLLSTPAAPAFASGGPHLHQPGTFIHLASDTQPAGFGPTCSGSSCNGKNPYSTNCAGQAWDSWWVAESALVKQDTNSSTAGYVQLWYSSTCQTNWARLVIQTVHAWSWVDVMLTDGSIASASDETGASTLIGPELFAPVLLACVHGTFAVYPNNSNAEVLYDGWASQPGWKSPGGATHC